MARTCTTFPWTARNGTLQLSSDLDRDQQDIIATIMTRIPQRIMRPYTAGTPDYTFRATNNHNLIAQKLAIAIEEQCPTISQCTGAGRVGDDGIAIAELYWIPKLQPIVQTLRIGIID